VPEVPRAGQSEARDDRFVVAAAHIIDPGEVDVDVDDIELGPLAQRRRGP
jgi:hypothetical protein